MSKFLPSIIVKHHKIFFCLILTLLGFFLRFYDYARYPAKHATDDEFHYAWAGATLITEGKPTSWSQLSAYKEGKIIKIDGNEYKLVSPILDSPPLFSLVVGILPALEGIKEFADFKLSTMRIPSLILGTASIALIYLLTSLVFGTRVAVLSALVFATSPGIVFSSRLAVTEVLLVFLLLLCLLCYVHYSKSNRPLPLALAAFFAGLASLTKVPGLFILFALVLLLLSDKKIIAALLSLLIGLAIFCLYPLFAAQYDFNLFLDVMMSQKSRSQGIDLFYYLINQHLEFRGALDLWAILGWLTLVGYGSKSKLITIPIICYFVTLLFTGAQGHYYGWYFIPFQPLLAISTALFLADMVKTGQPFNSIVFLITIVLWGLHYGAKIVELQNLPTFIIITISSLLASSFLVLQYRERKDHSIERSVSSLAILMIILSVGLNVLMVLNYERIG